MERGTNRGAAEGSSIEYPSAASMGSSIHAEGSGDNAHVSVHQEAMLLSLAGTSTTLDDVEEENEQGQGQEQGQEEEEEEEEEEEGEGGGEPIHVELFAGDIMMDREGGDALI